MVIWGEEVAEVVVEGMVLLEARRGGKEGEGAKRGRTKGARKMVSYMCRHTSGGCGVAGIT